MASEAKCAVCDGAPAHVDVHPHNARYLCCGAAHCCDEGRDAVGHPSGKWVVAPLPPATLDTTATRAVLDDVLAERGRQNAKWGRQDLPDGTGGELNVAFARAAQANCQRHASNGTLTYGDILEEEIAEAMAETDDDRLEEELIQVAAVAVQWVEAIRRRKARCPACKGERFKPGTAGDGRPSFTCLDCDNYWTAGDGGKYLRDAVRAQLGGGR